MDWTVDYGDGPLPCTVPHAWRQDVDVRWEGPAIYRRSATLPEGATALRFHGVSYAAEVLINGVEVARHEGIWDAFDVEVSALAGSKVELEVRVIKNGGATYPVREVASGFLPYVFHTFGGIYREVEVLTGPDRAPSVPLPRPLPYVRGALTWGWYPELGHPNPPIEVIREEVAKAKSLGFNLIKFCLWVPPHAFLEELERQGMAAWLELPLWDPSPDPDHLAKMASEIERIVDQYARHPNVLLWTVGCELSGATPPEYRETLVQVVKQRVPGLVKDNSGGAEMYGGDPREYGDFYDFHPYCDLPFYPQVLESLAIGARARLPILLGEFNDIDVHRDTAALVADIPYWASSDPFLNAQGVRWQYDFPIVLPGNRFTLPENEDAHQRLMKSSVHKAEFIRKHVLETVRSHSDIAGYVLTGWADTPISTAGFVDDAGKLRYNPSEVKRWNGPDCLFLIPSRRPPWIRGGNRPGWLDLQNVAEGPVLHRVGVHSERGIHGQFEWDVIRFSWEGGARGRVAHGAGELTDISARVATQAGEIFWEAEEPGGYLLRVNFAGVTNSWPIWVVAPWSEEDWGECQVLDPAGHVGGSREGSGIAVRTRGACKAGITFCLDEGTLPAPFWRECAYEFDRDFWHHSGLVEAWERWLPVSGDAVLDPSAFRDWDWVLTRIDTRTYAEAPVVAHQDDKIATTLRPFGALGNQPVGLKANLAGAHLMRHLLSKLR